MGLKILSHARNTESMATIKSESLGCIIWSNRFVPAKRAFISHKTCHPNRGASPMVYVGVQIWVGDLWLRKLWIERAHHSPLNWNPTCSWHKSVQNGHLRLWRIVSLKNFTRRLLIDDVTVLSISVWIFWCLAGLVVFGLVDLWLSWGVKIRFCLWWCDCSRLANQTLPLIL